MIILKINEAKWEMVGNSLSFRVRTLLFRQAPQSLVNREPVSQTVWKEHSSCTTAFKENHRLSMDFHIELENLQFGLDNSRFELEMNQFEPSYIILCAELVVVMDDGRDLI